MEKRIFIRYDNRKIYDTSASHYTTAEALVTLLEQGDEIIVVDKRTSHDVTGQLLAKEIIRCLLKNDKTINLTHDELRQIISIARKASNREIKSVVLDGCYSKRVTNQHKENKAEEASKNENENIITSEPDVDSVSQHDATVALPIGDGNRLL